MNHQKAIRRPQNGTCKTDLAATHSDAIATENNDALSVSAVILSRVGTGKGYLSRVQPQNHSAVGFPLVTTLIRFKRGEASLEFMLEVEIPFW